MSVPIGTLIPHRAPMQWINALIEWTDTSATASAYFGADHFAVAEGRVLETALVECMAQTVAAGLARRALAEGRTGAASQGMLVGASHFRIRSRPPLCKTLIIEARELRRLGPMLRIVGTISCEGQEIASGELSLYA
jgi:predicted hotdog family 3-hydroxylacyl-ACP dehydratase